MRAAGLDARWTHTRTGAPIIACRLPGKAWYVVDAKMFKAMEAEGVKPAFERFTLLGDYFSIRA